MLDRKAPRSSTRRWDVKSLLSVMIAGALLGGTVFVDLTRRPETSGEDTAALKFVTDDMTAVRPVRPRLS